MLSPPTPTFLSLLLSSLISHLTRSLNVNDKSGGGGPTGEYDTVSSSPRRRSSWISVNGGGAPTLSNRHANVNRRHYLPKPTLLTTDIALVFAIAPSNLFQMYARHLLIICNL
jgi:hypothetical protein